MLLLKVVPLMTLDGELTELVATLKGKLAVLTVDAEGPMEPPFNKLRARLTQSRFPQPNGNGVADDDTDSDDGGLGEADVTAGIVVMERGLVIEIADVLVYVNDGLLKRLVGKLAVFMFDAECEGSIEPPFNKLCARLTQSRFPQPNGNALGDTDIGDDDGLEEANVTACVVAIETKLTVEAAVPIEAGGDGVAKRLEGKLAGSVADNAESEGPTEPPPFKKLRARLTQSRFPQPNGKVLAGEEDGLEGANVTACVVVTGTGFSPI